MSLNRAPGITDVIGKMPYRMAFAGGWIDQPFVSQHNPSPPGSMVVVALEPTCRFMDRCGMGTSTRNVAMRLWNGALPDGDPATLVRELYAEENRGRTEPSGSQDMIGLLYPGVSRLDYDFAYEGGIFPVHVESTRDPDVAHWLEEVVSMVPVAQRPPGYSPLGDGPLPVQVRGGHVLGLWRGLHLRGVRRAGAGFDPRQGQNDHLMPNQFRQHEFDTLAFLLIQQRFLLGHAHHSLDFVRYLHRDLHVVERDHVLDDVNVLGAAFGDVMEQVHHPAVLGCLLIDGDLQRRGAVVTDQRLRQQ